MIYLVKNVCLRDKGYYDEDLTLWEMMNEVKEVIAENDIWGFGAKFDISCDNGILNWNSENFDFGFYDLGIMADEIRQIIKDIHDCLDKHNSTHIDLFFPNEGVVILLSTGEQIDSALFYKSWDEEGRDKKGYRQVTNHYNSTKLERPLLIALDFDYILHKKINYEWDMTMNKELRQLLKDCVKESKNVNYSLLDVRTRAEIEEDNRKQKQAEQEQKQQEYQQQVEKMNMDLQQMMSQFEQTKQQFMLMMAQYMAEKSQIEEDEEIEDEDYFIEENYDELE